MSDTPSLFDWVGGRDALLGLTTEFYRRVALDPVLTPVFAHMDTDHPAHVADFIGEVLGGPALHDPSGGGHVRMIGHHLNRHLTEAQRRRWFDLLLDTADAVGLAGDPEFRSAFVGYLEWGSRLAVMNSQAGVELPASSPMPKWSWGAPGGPYIPETTL
jgi:hemoglobin